MKLMLLLLYVTSNIYSLEINVGVDDNIYRDGRFVGWVNNRFLRVNEFGSCLEYYNDGKVQSVEISPSVDETQSVVAYFDRLKAVEVPFELLDNYIRLQVHIEAYGKSIHGLFLVSESDVFPKLLSDPKLQGVAIR